MQLDVLSLDLNTSRWTGKDAQAAIKANVVPADHDTIRLGARHVFAKHNFRTDFDRIDARLWITSNADLLGNVRALLPETPGQDQDPAGYASAYFPHDDGEPTLSFVLFVDEARLASLLTQAEGLSAGSIAIEVWIDGLKFGLPDEQIWELGDPDRKSQYLPVRHYSIEVAKLRTTRRAISDARDMIGNSELADSDDAEERKLGTAWMKDASRDAADQSREPSLAILRHCRSLLALLLICAVIAVVQRI